jgi:hypothetical protein
MNAFMRRTSWIGVILFSLLIIIFNSSCSSNKDPWEEIIKEFEAEPDPPQPEITYGEFPFKLVYELNGEINVVEDTVICTYDGVGGGANGKYRRWESHLANSDEDSVLLLIDDTRKIYCSTGSANYYMNDEIYPIKRPYVPHIYDVKLNKMDMSILSPEELVEKYNIKLISWEFSEPIINNFK